MTKRTVEEIQMASHVGPFNEELLREIREAQDEADQRDDPILLQQLEEAESRVKSEIEPDPKFDGPLHDLVFGEDEEC